MMTETTQGNGDAGQTLAPVSLLGRTVEWEIVLSGGHPDICVVISAPESATDAELQSLAETEAMAKTYIWSKKRVRPNAEVEARREKASESTTD